MKNPTWKLKVVFMQKPSSTQISSPTTKLYHRKHNIRQFRRVLISQEDRWGWRVSSKPLIMGMRLAAGYLWERKVGLGFWFPQIISEIKLKWIKNHEDEGEISPLGDIVGAGKRALNPWQWRNEIGRRISEKKKGVQLAKYAFIYFVSKIWNWQ